MKRNEALCLLDLLCTRGESFSRGIEIFRAKDSIQSENAELTVNRVFSPSFLGRGGFSFNPFVKHAE